jgi:LPXTG-site transpeptidase (sortase) family protein
MNSWDLWKRRREKKYRILYKSGPSTLALIFAGMAIVLWGIFALVSSYPVLAYLYYTVRPATSELLSQGLMETGKVLSDSAIRQTGNSAQASEPVQDGSGNQVDVGKDVSLPEGHYVAIPAIGVDTIIWEGSSEDYEQALRRGVWRVPDFSSPVEQLTGRPIILAAHRFGYLDWTQEYRQKNSFYDLPKLKPGDVIELTWDQHRYRYTVTGVEEGTAIRDYSSDLILYTCKFLVSPVRIFAYAKLVP